MRPRSVALSRLAVMPVAALAVLTTHPSLSSHAAGSTVSYAAVPVSAAQHAKTVAALAADRPAPHATTAHETVQRDRFFALVRYVGAVHAAEAHAAAVHAAEASAAAATQRQQPAPPAPVATPAPAPTTPAPASASNLNWSALAACESSGNPAAVSSGGYMGLYQFDQGTWQSVGGSGTPTAASPAEQTLRAQILYSQRGSSPWPVCGSRLFS